jgi:hypothetical protein
MQRSGGPAPWIRATKHAHDILPISLLHTFRSRFSHKPLFALAFSSDATKAANHSGNETGSSNDRMRTSVTNGLKKKLRELMGDFQLLRTKIQARTKAPNPPFSSFVSCCFPSFSLPPSLSPFSS